MKKIIIVLLLVLPFVGNLAQNTGGKVNSQSSLEVEGIDYNTYNTALVQQAESGDAYAQNGLGVCFANGVGVTQDYAKAVEWLTKSANQGHPGALYRLAMCYENGYVVYRNHEKAKELIEKAANLGNKQAKEALKNFE